MLPSLLKSALVAAMLLAVLVKGDSLRPGKYPNEPRKAALEAYFELGLLSKDDYETYTVEPSTRVSTFGVNRLHPNPTFADVDNILVQADEGGTVNNVKLTFEEMQLICASFCEEYDDENYKCEAVDVFAPPSDASIFRCILLDSSKGPGNVRTDDIDAGINAVLYKGNTNPFQEDTERCDLPKNVTAALGCLSGIPPSEGTCEEDHPPTLDLIRYILPAVQCVATKGGSVPDCLGCMTEALTGCNTAEGVCSEDKDSNIILEPCDYTKVSGKTTLPQVCGARRTCGSFCPEDCLAEIQTASLCQLGRTSFSCVGKVDGYVDYTCREEA